MRFVWDPKKDARNQAERDISFDFAASVFLDENRIEAPTRTIRGEVRYCVIGKAGQAVVLFVVFTSEEL